ncbi:MAG: hypothetical protein M1824_006413 [Vezdaea acicularis]|nr:MAG: hypothetical protein M1824_006413 [Vezdaea acicularis]
MADPLFELLVPHLDQQRVPQGSATAAYLEKLSTLSLAELEGTETETLAHTSHSLLLSLQALSSKSHKSIIASSNDLSTLKTLLPTLGTELSTLQDEIPKLDRAVTRFSKAYAKKAENALLSRRAKAMLLYRNVDRLSDILDLPTFLSSAISPVAAQANYASALDLHAHIKRLHTLYPNSNLISDVLGQAEEAMRGMTTNLIMGLRVSGIKLASGLRTIGWLKRIAPDVDLDALFLVCRLANLVLMLEALDPLRELADQATRDESTANTGQQSERYLKRYIEIFREQSFAIISMFKSIFPEDSRNKDLPSPLSTFPLHLVGLLTETLRQYLPHVRVRSSRESLLTQVLYCAGSLGRLGGDFSMVLAGLDDDWVEVMKKHRVLAGKLELLASGR